MDLGDVAATPLVCVGALEGFARVIARESPEEARRAIDGDQRTLALRAVEPCARSEVEARSRHALVFFATAYSWRCKRHQKAHNAGQPGGEVGGCAFPDREEAR